MESMDIYNLIKTRKSVRRYRDQAVETEKIERLLEAARLAPSASNSQEWRFVVVTDAEMRREVSAAASAQRFVAEAPVVLICCAETDKHVMRCGLPRYPIDVSIAVDHITLAAVAEGLGTCWIGAFEPKRIKRLLGIPDEIEIVALLTLGYPKNPEPLEKQRLPLQRIVYRERWG
jgi:nitroreductase